MRTPLAVAVATILGVIGPGAVAVAETRPLPSPSPSTSMAPSPSTGGVFRRTDLVGRHYDRWMADPDRIVSAIVELDGDTVSDRLVRAPVIALSAAERGLRTEQAGRDLALRAAGARVTGRLVNALNAVTVRIRAGDLADLQRVAGVKTVQQARIVQRDNALANAATGTALAWDATGFTGAGVTIGIIDDGIDYTHADFGGSGIPGDYTLNQHSFIEDGTFPTAKVVGGYDFAGDQYDATDPDLATPSPDDDPIACGQHGTHVAGTAAGMGVVESTGLPYAGPYDAATLAGVTFRVAPGSAPEARLRAYKVFGCTGSSDDSVIVAAIDKAIADKVDIINMSLGEPLGTGSNADLLVKAVTKANTLGTLVVVSAGNSGDGPYLVGSPSSASTALSVAAMDAGPTTYPGVAITTDAADDPDPLAAITGIETNEISVGAGITGPLKVVIPGCDGGDYAGVSGTIVVTSLVDGCVSPVFGALSGVLAVIVVVDEFFRTGFLDVGVPFVLVKQSEAAPLLAANGVVVDLTAASPVPNPQHGRFADFSSAGPRRGDSVMKPDISAPGVSLLSARVGTGTQAIEFSGTSMASPHVAGIAALVAQAHPTWKPAQLKAALMSTADPSAIADFDPTRGGTGLVGAGRAVDTVAYLSTSDGLHSLSFGFNALGSTFSRTKVVRITNNSSASITYDLSAVFTGPTYGATVTFSPARVTVRRRTSRTVTVRIRIASASIAGLPSASASDGGNLEVIDGLVVATPTGVGPGIHPLRMAFSMVPKGLSNVTAPTRTSGASGSGAMILRNSGRHAGTADVFAWKLHDRTGDNGDAEIPDIRDVGVKSYPYDLVTQTEVGPDRQVVFVISANKASSTHATQEFGVFIDVNGDVHEDYLLVAGDEGMELDGAPNGRFVTLTVDLESMLVVDAFTSEAPLNGSLVYLRAMASVLDTSALSPTWNFWAITLSREVSTGADDESPEAGFVQYHPYRPHLDAGVSMPIALAPGASVSVPFALDIFETSQADLGFLVVSPDDASGSKSANTVTVTGP